MGLTREICKACNQISAVGFSVPDEMWEVAVPSHLRNGVLCIACFVRFADEQLIPWDRVIQFHPVSLALHHGIAVQP